MRQWLSPAFAGPHDFAPMDPGFHVATASLHPGLYSDRPHPRAHVVQNPADDKL